MIKTLYTYGHWAVGYYYATRLNYIKHNCITVHGDNYTVLWQYTPDEGEALFCSECGADYPVHLEDVIGFLELKL